MLRLAARAAALAGCVFVVTVCGEQGKYPTTPGGSRGGGSGPGVTIQVPAKTDTVPVAVGDSVFVQVKVNDSRGVTSLILSGNAVRGSKDLGTDTTVERFTPRTVTLPKTQDTVITRYLRAVLTDSTSEFVTIGAQAVNTANDTTEDTSLVRVVNGPRVSVLQPLAGAVTAVGKSVTVSVRGIHPEGVKVLGWHATGVVTASDSTVFTPTNGVLADTEVFTSTLAVPSGTTTGNIVIEPFGTDSLDDPSGVAPGVTVSVQTVVGDTVPPLVQDTVPRRVEVDDSLTVTATDPSGITRVGFLVFDSTGTTLMGGDSVNLPGTSTNITQRFTLGLASLATFPTVVRLQAFAIDGATTPNRGVSTTGSVPIKSNPSVDTLTVVAGATIALPQGGVIGDAIVDSTHGAGADPLLLLTNTPLDQVEVFHLDSKTFGSAIRVGALPVGIALWPHDTLGHYADTVVVANSGGTNLSIVDLTAGAEVSRHTLPNYLIETVKTQPSSAGGIEVVSTPYDLSDRPQYVGTTCRHLTGGACDSVVAVYSTTPTAAQTPPFANHGYLAWENLSDRTGRSGHFFWELGAEGLDTVQITAIRDTLPGQPVRQVILGAGVGELLDLTSLALQESTFVRNSGDFNHAVIGEGGLDQGFARVMSYDARAGVTTTVAPPCPLRSPTTDSILAYLNCDITTDNGVSPGVYVSDFLVNRASRVLSVATNFNGRTNLVRADSIYVFDYTLKQTGLMSTVGTQAGIDMDPNNAFDAKTRTSGALNKNDRLVFAARADPYIDVFDTYWYQRVATIPIRDPIIGPIRVAVTGGRLVLAGVTARGVVVVDLPNVANPFPVRQVPGGAMAPVRTLPAVLAPSGRRP